MSFHTLFGLTDITTKWLHCASQKGVSGKIGICSVAGKSKKVFLENRYQFGEHKKVLSWKNSVSVW